MSVSVCVRACACVCFLCVKHYFEEYTKGNPKKS